MKNNLHVLLGATAAGMGCMSALEAEKHLSQ